jgi:hypothetical protein
MASMRLRSLSVASSEIIRISTHIEQGFRPSSRPMAMVKAGRPTSSSVIVRPSSVTSKAGRGRRGGFFTAAGRAVQRGAGFPFGGAGRQPDTLALQRLPMSLSVEASSE